MILVSKSLLAGIATTLMGILIFLGTYNTNVVVNPVEPAFSAVSGPDQDGPCTSVNGLYTCSYTKGFLAATTTPASVKSPAATSTLTIGVCQIPTGTGTAAVIDVGTSTTAFATTTINFVQQRAIASGVSDTFVVGTTSVSITGTTNAQVAPNTWFVLKTGAGLAGYTWPNATCKYQFVVAQRP